MYKTSLYRINGDTLTNLPPASIGVKETSLQQWIWDNPSLLGERFVLIGREVSTAYQKRIDLLALDMQCNVCVIELKRDKTPREVVAQALDYASWIAELTWDEINDISIEHFGESAVERYRMQFGELPSLPDMPEPRMLIVASEVDEASERIARFLADRGIAIMRRSSRHSTTAIIVYWLGLGFSIRLRWSNAQCKKSKNAPTATRSQDFGL